MKRFHVHVSVSDLNESIHFYSTLFGAEPTVLEVRELPPACPTSPAVAEPLPVP